MIAMLYYVTATKGHAMRKTLKSRWKRLTLRKKIFFILGSVIVFFFVHDLLELLLLAHPTEISVYQIRGTRYDPPLKTRLEPEAEYVSKEPAAISVEADWLSPLPLHRLKKKDYYLVSIQKSSERVFIIRKNMTFFLGMIGQSVYEIKTEPVRKKIYDQAIWRLAELGIEPDDQK